MARAPIKRTRGRAANIREGLPAFYSDVAAGTDCVVDFLPVWGLIPELFAQWQAEVERRRASLTLPDLLVVENPVRESADVLSSRQNPRGWAVKNDRRRYVQII